MIGDLYAGGFQRLANHFFVRSDQNPVAIFEVANRRNRNPGFVSKDLLGPSEERAGRAALRWTHGLVLTD